MGPARGQLLSSRLSGEGCGWARHQAPGGARASTRRSRPQGGLGGKQGVAAEGRRSRNPPRPLSRVWQSLTSKVLLEPTHAWSRALAID